MIVLYSLMFLGGYISAAGLGLTCPEWPLCPNGVMPSEEYLIEWTGAGGAASGAAAAAPPALPTTASSLPATTSPPGPARGPASPSH